MNFLQIAVFICAIAASYAVTEELIAELKSRCRQDIVDEGNSVRNIPLGVRLSFHDCVGDKGCDGCVDMTNADNAGLENVFDRIANYYNNDNNINSTVKEEFSLADWVALCGVAASEAGFENGGYPGDKQFSFKVGRITSPTCEGDNVGRFPHPHFNHAEVMQFFDREFGLDERQSTVLLGAHSLGRAAEDTSGWRGPWTDHAENLDNEFYQVLERAVNDQWHETEPTLDHYQWNVNPDVAPNSPLMMFHADMILIKNLTINEEGRADCRLDVSACPFSHTAPDVEELAADNVMFVEEFIDVFTIMIENTGTTGNNLTEVETANKQKQSSTIVKKLPEVQKAKKPDLSNSKFMQKLMKMVEEKQKQKKKH